MTEARKNFYPSVSLRKLTSAFENNDYGGFGSTLFNEYSLSQEDYPTINALFERSVEEGKIDFAVCLLKGITAHAIQKETIDGTLHNISQIVNRGALLKFYFIQENKNNQALPDELLYSILIRMVDEYELTPPLLDNEFIYSLLIVATNRLFEESFKNENVEKVKKWLGLSRALGAFGEKYLDYFLLMCSKFKSLDKGCEIILLIEQVFGRDSKEVMEFKIDCQRRIEKEMRESVSHLILPSQVAYGFDQSYEHNFSFETEKTANLNSKLNSTMMQQDILNLPMDLDLLRNINAQLRLLKKAGFYTLNTANRLLVWKSIECFREHAIRCVASFQDHLANLVKDKIKKRVGLLSGRYNGKLFQNSGQSEDGIENLFSPILLKLHRVQHGTPNLPPLDGIWQVQYVMNLLCEKHNELKQYDTKQAGVMYNLVKELQEALKKLVYVKIQSAWSYKQSTQSLNIIDLQEDQNGFLKCTASTIIKEIHKFLTLARYASPARLKDYDEDARSFGFHVVDHPKKT